MKRLNLSLSQWEDLLNPVWYQVGFSSTSTLQCTDRSLALFFNKEVLELGRIRKLSTQQSEGKDEK